MEVLISIIIPIYNAEKYIFRCIKSVMNQKISGFGIECILIDDCSQDDSILIANNIIDDYTGDIIFKMIRNETNKGLSASRNIGIQLSSGEYLFFLDSDDYIIDECIAKFVNMIKEVPDVDVVKGNHYDNNTISEYSIPSYPLENLQLLTFYYGQCVPVTAWNTLVRSDILKRNNIYFREGMIHEDDLWSVQLYQSINKFVFIPIPTYYYTSNPGSIMDKKERHPLSDLPYLILLLDELMDVLDNRLFVEKTMFLVSYLIKIFDIIMKYEDIIDNELYLKACRQRKRLIVSSLFNYRLILSLFMLILYKPFLFGIRYSFFRRNYDRLSQYVLKLALCFNPLH
jgi:glycosyltransferase involved in cell wall biosynthesis